MANYGISSESQNRDSRIQAQKRLEELENRCKSMICVVEYIREFGRVTIIERWYKKEETDEKT